MKTKPASTRPVPTARRGNRPQRRAAWGSRRDAGLGSGGAGFIPNDDEMLLSPELPSITSSWARKTALAHAGSASPSRNAGQGLQPVLHPRRRRPGQDAPAAGHLPGGMRRNRQMRVYYTSCNDFVNRWHEAVRDGQMSDFRNRFRHMDVLVVDDIHDIAQHDRLQEEFFLLNTLHQHGKQVVLSSDAAPCEISGLEERLTSRFNCGWRASTSRASRHAWASCSRRPCAPEHPRRSPRMSPRRSTRTSANSKRDHAHPEPRHDACRRSISNSPSRPSASIGPPATAWGCRSRPSSTPSPSSTMCA